MATGGGSQASALVSLTSNLNQAMDSVAITLNNQQQTIGEIIQNLKRTTNVDQRVQTVMDIDKQVELEKGRLDAVRYQIHQYLQGDTEARGRIESDHPDTWDLIVKGYGVWHDRIRRLTAAHNNVISAFNQAAWQSIFKRILETFSAFTVSTNLIKAIGQGTGKVGRAHLQNMTWEQYQARVNASTFQRLTKSRGRKGDMVSAADWDTASSMNPPTYTEDQYQAEGYETRRDGWLARIDTGARVTEASSSSESGSPKEVKASSRQLVLATRLVTQAAAGGAPDPDDEGNDDDGDDDDDSFDIDRRVADFDDQIDDENMPVQEFADKGRKAALESDEAAIHFQPRAGNEAAAKRRREVTPDNAPDTGRRTTRSTKRARAAAVSSEEEEEEEDAATVGVVQPPAPAPITQPAKPAKAKRHANCGCNDSIPSGIYVGVRKKLDAAGQDAMLAKWGATYKDDKLMCFRHLKELGGAVGLQTKIISRHVLTLRLRVLLAASEKGLLDKLKRTELHGWWRREYRPEVEVDKLGPYRWKSAPITLDFTKEAQLKLREAILTKEQIRQWTEDGSVNVDLFSWMDSQVIYDHIDEDDIEDVDRGRTMLGIIHDELDMYMYHLRIMNSIPNKGWLRNAFFSMGQQVMRQSPAYFALYCALRPDRSVRLVSYPYYCKYQVAADGTSTFFRHVDIDIERLDLHGRGANQIQGTLSLDHELGDDCTEILPGMHKPENLQKWVVMLRKSPVYKPGTLVHAITKDHWTAEMKEEFGGKDWTPVPCNAGEVRVTMPHLAHGAQKAVRTRRTMLPWFVSVDLDGNLEVVDSGTHEEIAAAHRDHMPARNSPSGLGNKYGAIRYPFPATYAITGLGPVSDSMVGRRNLDDPQVILDKKRLLLEPQNFYSIHKEWSKAAAKAVFTGWCYYVKNLEKAAFSDNFPTDHEWAGQPKSYFRRLELGLPTTRDSGNADVSKNVQEYAAGIHGDDSNAAQRVDAEVREQNRQEDAAVAAAPALVSGAVSDNLRAILSQLNFREDEVAAAEGDMIAGGESDADEVTQRAIVESIATERRSARASTRLATQIQQMTAGGTDESSLSDVQEDILEDDDMDFES